jgi:hypothetical protein
MSQPQPLLPFTKDDLRKALGAIWHKAPNDLRLDIDALCDEIQERGVTGDVAEGVPSAPPGFVPSPAGSMIPPPSAHAATDDEPGAE